jgi:4-amino-4-deoxy-L-arabinose transferase-like glycosyltransferase
LIKATACKKSRSFTVFSRSGAFLLVAACVFLLHLGLLHLPYFWDEAGYYVPAARDLLLTGSLIPRSTPSNAHPPLVLAYLALCWKLAGFSPLVTRSAMLLMSVFSLCGFFLLARSISTRHVAFAATICVAIYPVFFTESLMAQVDLPAAGLVFWALYAYVQRRPGQAALWFSLAALTKETAILVPLALLAWWIACRYYVRERHAMICPEDPDRATPRALLVPVVPLAAWYAYHYWRTGFVFGNPEFFRYNVQSTLTPLRVILALGLRVWQTFGYMQLGLLTLAMLLALCRPPLRDDGTARPRIALSVQFALYAIITVYVIAMSFIGGAVLARYMLPVVPLVILIAVSTLRRRLRYWAAIVAIVAGAFVTALFVNPRYSFSLEDNLAYRDYILLHQDAEGFLESRYPGARVLTAWPASDELTRPYLGYVRRAMRVFRVEDFTAEQLMSASEISSQFDIALVFSTKYEPPRPLIARWPAWDHLKSRFFGYHRDLPPALAAQILGGQVVFSESRKGQWIAVIETEKVMEAKQLKTQATGQLKPTALR